MRAYLLIKSFHHIPYFMIGFCLLILGISCQSEWEANRLKSHIEKRNNAQTTLSTSVRTHDMKIWQRLMRFTHKYIRSQKMKGDSTLSESESVIASGSVSYYQLAVERKLRYTFNDPYIIGTHTGHHNTHTGHHNTHTGHHNTHTGHTSPKSSVSLSSNTANHLGTRTDVEYYCTSKVKVYYLSHADKVFNLKRFPTQLPYANVKSYFTQGTHVSIPYTAQHAPHSVFTHAYQACDHDLLTLDSDLIRLAPLAHSKTSKASTSRKSFTGTSILKNHAGHAKDFNALPTLSPLKNNVSDSLYICYQSPNNQWQGSSPILQAINRPLQRMQHCEMMSVSQLHSWFSYLETLPIKPHSIISKPSHTSHVSIEWDSTSVTKEQSHLMPPLLRHHTTSHANPTIASLKCLQAILHYQKTANHHQYTLHLQVKGRLPHRIDLLQAYKYLQSDPSDTHQRRIALAQAKPKTQIPVTYDITFTVRIPNYEH